MVKDWDFEIVLEWMVGVFCGCVYIYGCGILYWDFKLENILVGDDGVFCIVDFGILVWWDAIRDGGLFGSLGYLVLEVLDGDLFDVIVDFYVVGVIVYYVLVRRFF